MIQTYVCGACFNSTRAFPKKNTDPVCDVSPTTTSACVWPRVCVVFVCLSPVPWTVVGRRPVRSWPTPTSPSSPDDRCHTTTTTSQHTSHRHVARQPRLAFRGDDGHSRTRYTCIYTICIHAPPSAPNPHTNKPPRQITTPPSLIAHLGLLCLVDLEPGRRQLRLRIRLDSPHLPPHPPIITWP